MEALLESSSDYLRKKENEGEDNYKNKKDTISMYKNFQFSPSFKIEQEKF